MFVHIVFIPVSSGSLNSLECKVMRLYIYPYAQRLFKLKYQNTSRGTLTPHALLLHLRRTFSVLWDNIEQRVTRNKRQK